MNNIKKIADEILEKKEIDDYNSNLLNVAEKMLFGIKTILQVHKQNKDNFKMARSIVTIVKNLRNIEKEIK